MINILFCGNSKVFDGILTCSLSILKRTETKEPFKFFVYTMDLQDLNENYKPISSAQISFLENVIKKYNAENSIEKNRCNKFIQQRIPRLPE